jgi:hypothetical protein
MTKNDAKRWKTVIITLVLCPGAGVWLLIRRIYGYRNFHKFFKWFTLLMFITYLIVILTINPTLDSDNDQFGVKVVAELAADAVGNYKQNFFYAYAFVNSMVFFLTPFYHFLVTMYNLLFKMIFVDILHMFSYNGFKDKYDYNQAQKQMEFYIRSSNTTFDRNICSTDISDSYNKEIEQAAQTPPPPVKQEPVPLTIKEIESFEPADVEKKYIDIERQEIVRNTANMIKIRLLRKSIVNILP